MDDRITLISQKNQGLSCARNLGIDKANGQYIMFVDSDDWIDSVIINTCITYMKNEYDLIMFDPVVNGFQREIDLEDGQHATGTNAFKTFNFFGSKCFYITVWQYIYRRDFVNKNNLRFYPGLIHEDELWTRCSLVCAESVVYCKKAGYYYENRMNSITTGSKNVTKSEAYKRIAVEIDKFRKSHYVDKEINEILMIAESKFMVIAVELVSEKIFSVKQLDDLINENNWNNSFQIDVYCCSLCKKLVQTTGKDLDNLIDQILQSKLAFKYFNEWRPKLKYEKKIQENFLEARKNTLYRICKIESFKNKISKKIPIILGRNVGFRI